MIGELELAWRLLPNRFVAVTGTNGKTTVAELLGHIWRTAGEPVAVAGNVGTRARHARRRDRRPRRTVICEASSFQLEDTEAFAPGVRGCCSTSPRTTSTATATSTPTATPSCGSSPTRSDDDVGVYNGADPALAGLELGGGGRRLDFARADRRDPIRAARPPQRRERRRRRPSRPRRWASTRDAIAAALRSFAGVAHRLERVAEIDGVVYVNDSKATNAAAAAAAIRSFDGGVRAILGGSLKGGDFAEPRRAGRRALRRPAI